MTLTAAFSGDHFLSALKAKQSIMCYVSPLAAQKDFSHLPYRCDSKKKRGLQLLPACAQKKEKKMNLHILGALAAAAAVSLDTACPVEKVALRSGLCMPFASDGDAMKHTPSINDTVAVSKSYLLPSDASLSTTSYTLLLSSSISYDVLLTPISHMA